MKDELNGITGGDGDGLLLRCCATREGECHEAFDAAVVGDRRTHGEALSVDTRGRADRYLETRLERCEG